MILSKEVVFTMEIHPAVILCMTYLSQMISVRHQNMSGNNWKWTPSDVSNTMGYIALLSFISIKVSHFTAWIWYTSGKILCKTCRESYQRNRSFAIYSRITWVESEENVTEYMRKISRKYLLLFKIPGEWKEHRTQSIVLTPFLPLTR